VLHAVTGPNDTPGSRRTGWILIEIGLRLAVELDTRGAHKRPPNTQPAYQGRLLNKDVLPKACSDKLRWLTIFTRETACDEVSAAGCAPGTFLISLS